MESSHSFSRSLLVVVDFFFLFKILSLFLCVISRICGQQEIGCDIEAGSPGQQEVENQGFRIKSLLLL